VAGDTHAANGALSRLHSNVETSEAVNSNSADVDAPPASTSVIVVCGAVVSDSTESSTSTSSKDAAR
jgi:hypothetical protein